LVAGVTEFWVTFAYNGGGQNFTIDAGANTIDYLATDGIGSFGGGNDTTTVGIVPNKLGHILYAGSGIWASDVLVIN
jgi:hypothetical protein